MSRTIEQVKQEYIECAQQAGDMQYRIECFKSDLSKLNNKMLALNEEASQLAKVQNEQPKAE
jgi:hypothetical protein